MTLTNDSLLDGLETTPSDEAGPPSASPGSARTYGLTTIKRWIRACWARWRSTVATVLVVTTVGVAASLFFIVYRPDQQIGDAAAHRVIQVASDGAVAVLSYAPDHMDRDFAKAKSYLTGDFLAYYTKFTEQIVAMAQQKQVTQTTQVVRAAVSELHRDSAVVLLFINQTAKSKQKPEPQTTASSARATLTKVKGSWLISGFDPVS